MDFNEICDYVSARLDLNYGNDDSLSIDAIEIQKKAIMGEKRESDVIRGRITEILRDSHLRGNDTDNPIPTTVIPAQTGISAAFNFPSWYTSIEDALFHELLGFAGLSQWLYSDKYKDSSSAKLIGERVYFMNDGRMELMPQTINGERRNQLIRALLLPTPDERLDTDSHEIYMMDGTRVTIFKNALCKDDQDAIIFRRYTVPEYTLEDQASRGTIPLEAIPFFQSMVALGYNVAFCGCVRSAKTTFLSTWQSLEDPMLEGVMVETDPEIPAHILMPDAPIVQLLADEQKLAGISKQLMRSDADYFILAEARDGVALDTAIRIAGKGSRRMKMTFHTRDPRKFTRDAAVEIVRTYGGDIHETALMVAGAFDFIFHFVHLRAANKKVLSRIYELGARGDQEYMNEICTYDIRTDSWTWSDSISEDKLRYGEEEDPAAYKTFKLELSMLSKSEKTGLPRGACAVPRHSARNDGSDDTSVIASIAKQSSDKENCDAI